MSAVSHESVSPRIHFEAESEFQSHSPPRVANEPTRQRKAKKAVPLRAIVFCASLTLVLALGLVAQRSRLMLRSEELAFLHEELAREQRVQNHLQLELMRSRTPQQIDRLARERLGMQEPARVEYLVLIPAQEAAPQSVGAAQTPEHGTFAQAARWLTANWPRWGQAEARHRP